MVWLLVCCHYKADQTFVALSKPWPSHRPRIRCWYMPRTCGVNKMLIKKTGRKNRSYPRSLRQGHTVRACWNRRVQVTPVRSLSFRRRVTLSTFSIFDTKYSSEIKGFTMKNWTPGGPLNFTCFRKYFVKKISIQALGYKCLHVNFKIFLKLSGLTARLQPNFPGKVWIKNLIANQTFKMLTQYWLAF